MEIHHELRAVLRDTKLLFRGCPQIDLYFFEIKVNLEV